LANSCAGTDLNRNWDYHWGESGASKYSCAEIYRGVKAGSELETQAVVQYITKNPNVFKVSDRIKMFNDKLNIVTFRDF